MDRYFESTDKVLTGSDLHLTGICSMFIASKYEDVVPILMKTVVNKVGHNKFTQIQIEERELEILRVLSYKIGAPTVKEFIDRLMEEVKFLLPASNNIYKICIYLAKLACHNYKLMQI